MDLPRTNRLKTMIDSLAGHRAVIQSSGAVFRRTSPVLMKFTTARCGVLPTLKRARRKIFSSSLWCAGA
jgi:hypothetical protein